ncbi:hypothetical protein AAF712_006320 [Marasmius tenuissimus]|uniref:Class E vacuolar protein-sorting machinery protein HSE1 n=1 Tax=Marasmius tenuissimus TaxID=585030 RepID=A0ABR2ZZF5_9AGAR
MSGMFGGGSANPYDDIVNKTTDENLTSENWELILNLCDKVQDEGPEGARNVIAAILKRLAHRNANVQLYGLSLVEALSKNCGAEVHREIASKAFTQGLEKLVTDRNTHEKVRRRTLELIAMWTAEFQSDTQLGIMEESYNNLKSKNYKFEAPNEPPPPTVDDEIRRKEEEELQRVLEMSMTDKATVLLEAAAVAALVLEARATSLLAAAQALPQLPLARTVVVLALDTYRHRNDGASLPSGGGGYASSEPDPEPAPAASPVVSQATSTPTPTLDGPIVTRVRALHTFEPSEPGELGFNKGDIIRVVDRGYKDWWRGQLKGRTGIFPVNYVEALPEPSANELAREAEQEAAVFSQAVNVDKLLNMLRALDPQKDNLADNEEIQELYRSSMALRPKIVKLIDKYSQKRADLVSMNETFVRARSIFEQMMEESLARHTGVYDSAYRPPSVYTGHDPRARAEYSASPSPGSGPGYGPASAGWGQPGGAGGGGGYTPQFPTAQPGPYGGPGYGQPQPQQQPQQPYGPGAAPAYGQQPQQQQQQPQQYGPQPYPVQQQGPGGVVQQQQAQVDPQQQQPAQQPVQQQQQPVQQQQQPVQQQQQPVQQQQQPVQQQQQQQAQAQPQQQQQAEGPPYVYDPNKTYGDPNVQAWAQYYAQGGKDPTGSVYFVSVPGVKEGPPPQGQPQPQQPVQQNGTVAGGVVDQAQGQPQQQQQQQRHSVYQQPQSASPTASGFAHGVQQQQQQPYQQPLQQQQASASVESLPYPGGPGRTDSLPYPGPASERSESLPYPGPASERSDSLPYPGPMSDRADSLPYPGPASPPHNSSTTSLGTYGASPYPPQQQQQQQSSPPSSHSGHGPYPYQQQQPVSPAGSTTNFSTAGAGAGTSPTMAAAAVPGGPAPAGATPTTPSSAHPYASSTPSWVLPKMDANPRFGGGGAAGGAGAGYTGLQSQMGGLSIGGGGGGGGDGSQSTGQAPQGQTVA